MIVQGNNWIDCVRKKCTDAKEFISDPGLGQWYAGATDMAGVYGDLMDALGRYNIKFVGATVVSSQESAPYRQKIDELSAKLTRHIDAARAAKVAMLARANAARGA